MVKKKTKAKSRLILSILITLGLILLVFVAINIFSTTDTLNKQTIIDPNKCSLWEVGILTTTSEGFVIEEKKFNNFNEVNQFCDSTDILSRLCTVGDTMHKLNCVAPQEGFVIAV